MYWSVYSSDDAHLDGGAIDTRSSKELTSALATCAASHGVESTLAGNEASTPDLSRTLRVHGTVDELALNGALSALVPGPLRERATGAAPVANLLISLAPDLAMVPWPVVDLFRDRDGRRHSLLDAYTLRFVPALSVVADTRRQRSSRWPHSDLRLLLSCDYLGEYEARPPKPAAIQLGSPAQRRVHPSVLPATSVNFVAALRRSRPGTRGITFIRAHYESVPDLASDMLDSGTGDDVSGLIQWHEDPGQSGIALFDGLLPAGFLCVRDEERGQMLVDLTSHVIAACCSSAGLRPFNGGEALGLAASCLRGGATCVIATAVDVLNCAFADELDDLLLAGLRSHGDHFAALHDVQLDLQRRWRRASSASAETADAHPIVWAYYQAFGIE